MRNRSILAVAEHAQGRVKPSGYEVIACALRLESFRQLRVLVVLIGDQPEAPAREIFQRTGLDVIAVQTPGLASYNGEAHRAILTDLIAELDPACLCAAHSSQGADFAPGLAARVGAACITAVERISVDSDCVIFARGASGGKLVAELAATTRLAVITVQPGAFSADVDRRYPQGSIEFRTVNFEPHRSRALGFKPGATCDKGLSEARVIVAAGRGIGKQENLSLVQDLAAAFPRSAIGGSRPVCDMGWLEYKSQIGLTGATVSPQLYIACGISGSAQHVAGIRDAGFVVAINSDPNAAIFNVADLCIVEDLTTFIPTFLAELHRASETPTSKENGR
ncbi:MAG: electron transfer flavoprotein subunit alpha/FixB family protein [Deltaproteobacteria bacterium]|nr:electron transfer flavoprotein subunit alpha/FixB family protein [Deltaproteobacteria bacterium]